PGRVLEEVVLVGRELAVALVRSRLLARGEQRLVELGLALAGPVADDPRDLVLGDEGALDPLQARGADRTEQHVALAEEALGAALVEDHPRVDLGGDGERYPGRDVDLDRP